jgi:SAM-dependent methyltransferase
MTDTSPDASATAHRAWDRRWQREDERALWREVEDDVRRILPVLAARGARRVLDLGCGIGRHALFFAAAGLEVEAVDGSSAGLAEVRAEADRRRLTLALRCHRMTALPYTAAIFDYVLAWNVVYHGAPRAVATVLNEIERVLRPGGLFQGTMLSKRNAKHGLGRRVDADTFVIDGEEDKAHPHFYCDDAGLRAMFKGFAITALDEREHRTPGSWHWHFLAERTV